jgi:precorrin-6B methylase 2
MPKNKKNMQMTLDNNFANQLAINSFINSNVVTLVFFIILALYMPFSCAGENFFDQYKSKDIVFNNKYSSVCQKVQSSDEVPTLNETGLTSRNGCFNGGATLLIHSLLQPNKNPIVIDIGSGLGGCAKTMGFLGYKVFSIDTSPKHIKDQEKNYCNPLKSGLIYDLAKIDGYDFNEKRFKDDCEEIKKKQVFIDGNFTGNKVKTNLPLQKWNIVIAHNVFQFMTPEVLYSTLKLTKEQMSENGVIDIIYSHKHRYGKPEEARKHNDNYQLIKDNLEDLGFNILFCAHEDAVTQISATLMNSQEIDAVRFRYKIHNELC